MIPAIIIGIALISIFIYFANNPFSSGIKKTDRIEIKNGTTGEQYVLEGEDAAALADKLLNIDSKVSGIKKWHSGYSYIIYIYVGDNVKKVVVNTGNFFETGLFTYDTDDDIKAIVQDAVGDNF